MQVRTNITHQHTPRSSPCYRKSSMILPILYMCFIHLNQQYFMVLLSWINHNSYEFLRSILYLHSHCIILVLVFSLKSYYQKPEFRLIRKRNAICQLFRTTKLSLVVQMWTGDEEKKTGNVITKPNHYTYIVTCSRIDSERTWGPVSAFSLFHLFSHLSFSNVQLFTF